MENRVKVNCKNRNCLWNIGGVCTNPDSITIDEDLRCEEYDEMPFDITKLKTAREGSFYAKNKNGIKVLAIRVTATNQIDVNDFLNEEVNAGVVDTYDYDHIYGSWKVCFGNSVIRVYPGSYILLNTRLTCKNFEEFWKEYKEVKE